MSLAQVSDSSTQHLVHTNINASTLSVHPLGLFMSRLQGNFQQKADLKPSFSLSLNNGNVWLPPVSAYHPLALSDQQEMEAMPWHYRQTFFDPNNSPNESEYMFADGVIRQYLLKFNLPISDQQEVKIATRMFSLDKGKQPLSFFTSDQFIEWFHSNIAGGVDPFARKIYGYNKAKIVYKDRQNDTLSIDDGDFVFSGIDLGYAFYPNFKAWEKKQIYTNFNVQLGVNTHKFNPSLDLGISATLTKTLALQANKELRFSANLGLLKPGITRFVDGVQLTSAPVLFNSHCLIEYVKPITNEAYLSFATTWYFQSAYFRKSDEHALVLSGDRYTTHWHYSLSHLYRKLSANSFIVSYTKNKSSWWIYLREDLLVDNAPDAQTGIGYRYTF